ncbi:pectinesterase family protein [Roseateles sp.]|uniref:pectinesterase family protein n=1 Tax=Roseateles sp. TaxID=1971397 RepID=UPI003BA95CA2
MRVWGCLLMLASAAQAADLSAYLGDWRPAPLADLAVAAPDVVVRPGDSLQAAIDALPARGSGTKRWVVQIQPGHYRGPLCIRDKAPLALVGSPLDAAAVVLVDGRYNAMPRQGAAPCEPDSAAATYGTAGSTTVAIHSDDVQLLHLTIANDAMDRVRGGDGYPPGAGESGGAQAVALTLAGDRIQLDGVRLLGHQDTLYVRRPDKASAARVLVRHSLIAGDVDFIFGNATLVIDHSTLLSRAGRRTPGQGGIALAPSTAPDVAHGFLVTHSRFVAEPGLAPASVALGRAWDAGVKPGTWAAGRSPNGQALVQHSELGAHIGPWAASTSRRPFDAAVNRLAELDNIRP